MNAAQLHLKPDTWLSIVTPRDVWHLVGKPVTIRVKVVATHSGYRDQLEVIYDLTPMGYPLVRGGIPVHELHRQTQYLYDRSRPWVDDRLEVELSSEQHAFLVDWGLWEND